LLGFAALPVTLRFLRFLPERGYAFAKPLAILLWVYPFWLLGVLGFLQNSFGALALVIVVLTVVSWGLVRGRGDASAITWLRANWRYVLVAEAVFAVAFVAFAYFRAFNPEITATEKPMEFMFLNSILRSETFPPRDAWLSGFAISYYYLGYVIVAALSKLGSIPSGYAFNLGLTMTYALTAVGAFGMVFNLISAAQTRLESGTRRRSLAPYAFGILAVFLVLVIGNLQGAVEVAYNANLGPREQYARLNLHGLEEITPSGNGIPQDNWWWWRASRVVNDTSPNGGHVEVIDEFPSFSFLLGDLHPHVLSLPFCLLALAVAFNLLLAPPHLTFNLPDLARALATPRMLLTALVVGALGMLNTWDIVTYGIIIASAFFIAQFRGAGTVTRRVLMSSGAFLVVLFVGGYLLFLPFYMGFASQARGVVPEIFNKTPLHAYLIMFGIFVFVYASLLFKLLGWQRVLPYLLFAVGGALLGWGVTFLPLPVFSSQDSPWFWVGAGAVFGFALAVARVLFLSRDDLSRDLSTWTLLILFVPVVIAILGFAVLWLRPSLQAELAGSIPVADGESVASSLLRTLFTALVSNPGVFLLLAVFLAASVTLLRVLMTSGGAVARDAVNVTPTLFVLLLGLVGFALTFGVEFLYIRDSFGTRMNTVFKLYYQSWLMLAIACAFGAFYLWQSSRPTARALWLGAFSFLFALSMIYPALAYPNRANNFESGNGLPTLDGWRWVERVFPDDYAAIEWVRGNVPRDSVILEAAGAQYSFDNRVSVATGLSTVLGWGGHEFQWRGNSEESDPRARDIEEIYRTRDLARARELLDDYRVSYVIVGDIERGKYKLAQPSIDKFAKMGEMVFEQGGMRVYRVGSASVSVRAP
jgi:uncharacterized membrane protein